MDVIKGMVMKSSFLSLVRRPTRNADTPEGAITRNGIGAEVELEEVEVGLDAQPCLAKCSEDREVKYGVRIQVVNPKPVVEKNPPEEAANREVDATLKEARESHHLVGVGRRSGLPVHHPAARWVSGDM
jgi:hypothetical protein